MGLLIDLMSYHYLTFYFLNVLNSKNIIYIIITGLIMDIILFNTYYFTFILTILYFIDKLFNNYYLINILNYVIFIIIFSIINKYLCITLFLNSILLEIVFIFLNRYHIIK